MRALALPELTTMAFILFLILCFDHLTASDFVSELVKAPTVFAFLSILNEMNKS